MQPSDIEKLKSSIQVSTILSAGEREEWQTLLPLMNDMQLLELQKILATEKPKINLAEALTAAALATKSEQKPAAQIPRLSHLVNLPNPNLSRPATPPAAAAPAAARPTTPPPQKSPFADKLKATLAEKELPAGIPEADLPEPKHAPIFTEKPAAVASLASFLPKDSKPKTETVAPVKTAAPVKPPLPAAKLVTILEQPKQPSPKPAEKRAPPVLPKSPGFTPPKIPAAHLVDIKLPPLQELSDLSALDSGILQPEAFDSVLVNLRKLVKSQGYFDVVFSIEKSPLYQNYIRTGQELMTQDTDFETLKTRAGGKDFLSRPQFEEFADILRQIQVE